jgi:L-alanine-DL-glutamate epimerase-like enolase superfamily enzyme
MTLSPKPARIIMSSDRRTFIKHATLAGAGMGFAPHAYAAPTASSPHSLPAATDWDGESDLVITRIESYTASYATIVRVVADDGSEGFGQLAPYNNDITTTVLHRLVAPHALGCDPYQMGAIADHCIETNYKFPWSFVCRATSGLETALWDLRGKREGQSVCALLGGTPRPLPVYGSSMRRDITPSDEADRIARLRDSQGFEAFKIRVGKTMGHNEDEWPGRTEAILPTVRQAVGDDVMLLADANSCYTPDKAIEVGQMMQEHGYYFFEEPCPFWQFEWTAEVNAALDMHVAGGEQDNNLAQWRRMLTMDAVDIAQPDVCYLGGVSRTLKVAEMAEATGKRCVPHSANRSLLTVFSMHILAAIPNPAPHLEYSIEEVDWVKGIYEPMPEIVDGQASFPDGPGWGVRIRPEWLQRAEQQVSDA